MQKVRLRCFESQPHQSKKPRVALPAEREGPLGRSDEFQRHDLLLNWRQARAGAVAPRLDPPANLLLLDRGEVLEGPPVAAELVENDLEPRAGLRCRSARACVRGSEAAGRWGSGAGQRVE